MSITWNTGTAAERARHNLKLKQFISKRIKENMGLKPDQIDNDHCERPAAKAPSSKLQAPSATKKTQLKCINNLERRNYESNN